MAMSKETEYKLRWKSLYCVVCNKWLCDFLGYRPPEMLSYCRKCSDKKFNMELRKIQKLEKVE